MKGSEFVFGYVHLLYYKCHKINPNPGGSNIDYINKKDNKCFQYDLTVALNHEENKKALQRTTKIKPFRNKYNWKGINFHQKKMIGKNLRKIM